MSKENGVEQAFPVMDEMVLVMHKPYTRVPEEQA